MIYECHGHIIADGVSYQDAMARHQNGVDTGYVRQTLSTVAAAGIGYYRDGGDKYGVSAYAKKIAGEYGIEYRTPVFIAHKTGYYGSMYGRGFDTLRDFRVLIRESTAQGADFVKLTVSGMLDFTDGGKILGPVFGGEELREAAKIAHGEGMAVMAHCNGADNMKMALESGVDSLEHGFWPDGSVIPYFLQTNAVWVPTCVAVYNLIGEGRYNGETLRRIHEAQREVLIEAYKRGVLIAAGSDCGAYMVMQGKGTLDEYAVLANMGIDPEKGNRAVRERFRRD
jgi:hypothetical protein